jgi:hypothetical protein
MTDAVEARFYVAGMARRSYDLEATEVELVAVSRGEHNKNWARATPSGSIKMVIKNNSAAQWFVDRLGTEVSVVFSPASSDD